MTSQLPSRLPSLTRITSWSEAGGGRRPRRPGRRSSPTIVLAVVDRDDDGVLELAAVGVTGADGGSTTVPTAGSAAGPGAGEVSTPPSCHPGVPGSATEHLPEPVDLVLAHLGAHVPGPARRAADLDEVAGQHRRQPGRYAGLGADGEQVRRVLVDTSGA